MTNKYMYPKTQNSSTIIASDEHHQKNKLHDTFKNS